MKRLMFLFYSAIILFFSGKTLVLNTWDLINLKLPQYYINPFLLSGTLLLYDRPMFFETRTLGVKERGKPDITTMEYDLRTKGYQSYLQRRLFRFATNENSCGGDSRAAIEDVFCKSKLEILKDKKIDEITISFEPHLKAGRQRTFHHVCAQNE